MAKILVVDDDHTVREVAVSYLRAGGHDVADVDTGEAALKAMREDPADLVVLDLMLPGIDGLEVCRRLREQRDVLQDIARAGLVSARQPRNACVLRQLRAKLRSSPPPCTMARPTRRSAFDTRG